MTKSIVLEEVSISYLCPSITRNFFQLKILWRLIVVTQLFLSRFRSCVVASRDLRFKSWKINFPATCTSDVELGRFESELCVFKQPKWLVYKNLHWNKFGKFNEKFDLINPDEITIYLLLNITLKVTWKLQWWVYLLVILNKNLTCNLASKKMALRFWNIFR